LWLFYTEKHGADQRQMVHWAFLFLLVEEDEAEEKSDEKSSTDIVEKDDLTGNCLSCDGGRSTIIVFTTELDQ